MGGSKIHPDPVRSVPIRSDPSRSGGTVAGAYESESESEFAAGRESSMSGSTVRVAIIR
jgi:hypothetical protein